MADFNSFQIDRNEEFGFKENVAGFSTKISVSKDTIRIYAQLKITAKVADKHCIICLKSNMTLKRLSIHLSNHHDINLRGDEDDCTIGNWLEAETTWQTIMKNILLIPIHAIMILKKEKMNLKANLRLRKKKKKVLFLDLASLPLGIHTRTAHRIAPPPARKRIPREDFMKRLTNETTL